MTVSRDELRHAFAILGLAPDTKPSVVRRRYKSLVKKWHPDRFTDDPQGILEATQRMRSINNAYETIQACWLGDHLPPVQAGRQAVRETPLAGEAMASLDRERLEKIIAAIRLTREPFWERVQGDPWNRSLSLVVAIIDLLRSIRVWNTSPQWEGKSTLALSIVSSVALLPLIWSDNKGRRVFGWFFLLFFKLFLPLFSALMMYIS